MVDLTFLDPKGEFLFWGCATSIAGHYRQLIINLIDCPFDFFLLLRSHCIYFKWICIERGEKGRKPWWWCLLEILVGRWNLWFSKVDLIGEVFQRPSGCLLLFLFPLWYYAPFWMSRTIARGLNMHCIWNQRQHSISWLLGFLLSQIQLF